jgi:hypothetical protein
VSVRVRSASDDDDDLAAIATMVDAVTPDDPTSIDELRTPGPVVGWHDMTAGTI